MTYQRPIDTTANPQWMQAERPVDLIPTTSDPTGQGARMVQLLRAPMLTQGPLAGARLGEHLLDWQAELCRYIFGARNAKGERAIRRVMLKIGKGNGKSTVAGLMTLAYVMWLAENGLGTRGLVQIISSTSSAADIVFNHILEAIRADPMLKGVFGANISKRIITHGESGIQIEVTPAKIESTAGRRPIAVVVDELHVCAITCRNFSTVLDQAVKGGRNWGDLFLMVCITTSPPERALGLYSEMLEYARKVRDGEIDDPSFLPCLFEYPTERADLDLTDSATWWRGCPSAAGNGPLALADLEDEFSEAKRSGIQRDMALFLSQRLGVEPSANPASAKSVLQDMWDCLDGPEEPATWPDAIGLDLGGIADPCALAYVWREGPAIGLRVQQFLTTKGYEESPELLRSVYDQAIAANELLLFDTTAEMDDFILTEFKQFGSSGEQPALIGGDQFGRAGFSARVNSELYKDSFIAVSQGWKLLGSYAAAESLAADRLLRPLKTPLLSFNIANLMVQEGPKGRQFQKADAGDSGAGVLKIDGAMASLSALQILLEHESQRFDAAALIV